VAAIRWFHVDDKSARMKCWAASINAMLDWRLSQQQRMDNEQFGCCCAFFSTFK